MKGSSVDPVADVLLDFQSVMAQFLELQTDIFGALERRRSMGRASPLAMASTGAAGPDLSSASGHETGAEAPVVHASARPVVERPEQRERPEPGHVPLVQAAFSRYTLTVRERPAGSARAALARGHAIVLTDDGRGVASLVAERLRRDGHRVAIISAAGSPDPGHDLFVSPLDSAEEAERVAHLLGESLGPVGALIHLAPLSASTPFEAMDAASWWSRLSSETRTLFLIARSLGASLEHAGRNGGAVVLAATSMGGAFGTTSVAHAILPSQGGVAGFAKCLAIEWPDVRVRAVDLDATEPIDALAAHLIGEMWAADSCSEIGYLNGRRVSVDVVHRPAPLDRSFVIPSDAVILATGGARGITAEVCLELAERYQPIFVLVGQSPLPPLVEPPDLATLTTEAVIKRMLTARLQAGAARVTPAMVDKAYRQLLKEREIRGTISKLTAAGARTHYVQLDVQDAQAFGALIDDIYATYGRLDGVIHGAGIIEDKRVRDKSLESFDRVFQTKAVSAFVLSRHLKPESLRFAVFFSSVAGRFGNRGQADYAAANEVVSKLAVVLQQRWPVRVCAIAWAPWDKLGMVSPELKREFARRGVELLSPVAGRRALWQEIQQSPSAGAEVVVGGHAALQLATDVEHERLPLLKHATREDAHADAARFMRDLDPSVDLYLDDHRLDGRPVLPLSFATEFMAEAAQAAWPDLRVVAVRSLQLLKGIVVDSAPVPIVITVRTAVQSSDTGVIDVDVDISTPSMQPSVRYRSVVQLASRGVAPPAFDAPAWPLVPLPKTLDRVYRDWTFHGPLFQRVTDIAGLGPNAMLGTIYSSSVPSVLSNVGRPLWVIDPFVFDAALQLILIWSRARNDKTALPSRFRSFAKYGTLSDQRLDCYVAVESLAGGHALESQVHFVDAMGRVLAQLDTMETTCTHALNRLALDGPLDGSAT
jgi:NAD(P)-dependent dehydrogenase (short-subunit alcohol dehydrogenase family)